MLTKRVFKNMLPQVTPEKVYCVYCHRNIAFDKAQPIGQGMYRCKTHSVNTIVKKSKKIMENREVDNS